MTDPDEEPTFFFVHVHKTAGTSLWWRLGRVFDPVELFPNDDDGVRHRRTLSVDDLAERWPQRRHEVRVLAGHFPLCTREVLGGEFITFTLLRDPVERVLSALREQRQKTPAFAEASFEEIYHEPLRRLMLHNNMVKMFSLRPEEMDEGVLTDVEFTRDHLERAIDGLATVGTVGFQDRFEPFCELLSEQFGWDLGDPVVTNPSRPEDIPQSLIDEIAEDNALDIEFYADAVKRYRTE